jgi:hypothetical protein
MPVIMTHIHDNLMNTSLFNFIYIDTCVSLKGGLVFSIDVKERWYLWPFPIFEISDRNFNSWLQKGDLSRINYGLYLVLENFRGRRESLKLLTRFGFEQKYSFTYIKPFVDRKQKVGLGMTCGLGRSHTTPYMTVDNEQQYYRDEDHYAVRSWFVGLRTTYRPGIHSEHTFKIYFDQYYFKDTILKLNPSFSTTSSPGYFTVYYQYELEHRDYNKYPLRGYYFNLEFEQKGLGLLKGEDLSVFSVKGSFRKYWELDTRLFLSGGIFGKYSRAKSPAYFIEQGLGYGSETIRSLEYYVVDGESYFLVKSQLKYQLLKTRVLELKFLPLNKFNRIPVSFFLNLYYDWGYVSESRQALQSDLANRYLHGGGLGLDFVTYYDQVIRLDYSVNMFLEHGFFLHFMAPF